MQYDKQITKYLQGQCCQLRSGKLTKRILRQVRINRLRHHILTIIAHFWFGVFKEPITWSLFCNLFNRNIVKLAIAEIHYHNRYYSINPFLSDEHSYPITLRRT